MIKLVAVLLFGACMAAFEPYRTGGDWPPIELFPENFRLNFQINHYNHTTKKLEPWRNATGYQLIDSDGNRELVVLQMMREGKLMNVSMYLDCEKGETTYKIPDKDYCVEQDWKISFNLRDMLDEIKDPGSGVTRYRGIVKVPYSKLELHQFEVNVIVGPFTSRHNLYYDKKTKNLRYITTEGHSFIYCTKGNEERSFSDKDFAGYTNCEGEEGCLDESPSQ